MASKYVYDRYRVAVPGDLADDLESLREAAIAEARERARLYVMPCAWWAKPVSELGGHEVVFVVTRKRLRKGGA